MFFHFFQSLEDAPNETTPLTKKEKSHPALKLLPIFVGETQEGRLMVGKEKFEMSELCQMFMGNHWKHFFTVCTGLYNYGWYAQHFTYLDSDNAYPYVLVTSVSVHHLF